MSTSCSGELKTHTQKTIAEMTGASLQLAGLEVCSIFRPIYFNVSLVLFCYILYTVCISFPHEICVFEKKKKINKIILASMIFYMLVKYTLLIDKIKYILLYREFMQIENSHNFYWLMGLIYIQINQLAMVWLDRRLLVIHSKLPDYQY